METQGSLLGTLVLIWIMVGLVSAYFYCHGQRRRGLLGLFLGIFMTVVLFKAGGELGAAMG